MDFRSALLVESTHNQYNQHHSDY